MKAFFKWLGIGVLVIILGAAAWGTHEWNAEKRLTKNARVHSVG
jgi:hypothetical protein